jgi:hypothetical protein
MAKRKKVAAEEQTTLWVVHSSNRYILESKSLADAIRWAERDIRDTEARLKELRKMKADRLKVRAFDGHDADGFVLTTDDPKLAKKWGMDPLKTFERTGRYDWRRLN